MFYSCFASAIASPMGFAVIRLIFTCYFNDNCGSDRIEIKWCEILYCSGHVQCTVYTLVIHSKPKKKEFCVRTNQSNTTKIQRLHESGFNVELAAINRAKCARRKIPIHLCSHEIFLFSPQISFQIPHRHSIHSVNGLALPYSCSPL